MPAIRDYSQAYTTATSGTTIVVPMPAYEQNDLLVAVLSADTGTATWSATGWTEYLRQTNTVQLCVMYKIAGASEGDVTFTASASETFNGSIISIRDVNTTTPFNGTAATKNSSSKRDSLPTMQTTINNCLILYLAACINADVPSIIEGPCSLIFGKDGSAHSDGAAWGFMPSAGNTPANVYKSSIGTTTATNLLATIAIAPPSGGANVIPGYCAADSSLYLTPLTGQAYNGDDVPVTDVTTDFGSSLNGKTLTAAGNTLTRPDFGLNSYHAMLALTGITTSGSYAGNRQQFATANKPNVSGKNILFHGNPYLPVDIQTTDSVSLTGAMGIAIGLCSAANTNYKWWHVHGANTPWGVARTPLVVNPSNTSGVIQTTGTLDATSIYSIGFAVSGKNVIPDWVFGSVWALDTTTVCGGNSSEPLDIPQIVNAAAVGHERMSVIQQGSSQMLVLQPLQIGNGGANPVYLDLDATATEFPKQYSKATKQVNYCSVDNVAGLKYYPGASDTIKHRNSVISSESRFHWGLHASASTSANYDFSGSSVIGAGTITLARAITIDRLTINDYSTIDASGLTLTNGTILGCPSGNDSITLTASSNIDYCDINVSGVTAGNRWCSVADPTIFTYTDFTGGGGHAIRLTTPGTYNLVGNTFTGFGADGSTGAAILNDSGGAVTLNISGGGNTPTVKNGTGASTTVSSAITLTITVADKAGTVISGALAYIDNNDQSPFIMNTTTNGSGVASTTYAGSPVTGSRWRVRKYGYKEFSQLINISSSDITLPVTLVADPQQT